MTTRLTSDLRCSSQAISSAQAATLTDGRWRAYSYDDLLQRDKVSLDIFWLKDEDLEGESDAVNLDDIMAEIVYDLRAALAQFEEIQSDLVAAQT